MERFKKEQTTESTLAVGREAAAKERRLRELAGATGKASEKLIREAATAARIAEIKRKLKEAEERIANT
ncbi:MAG: hypothetical protein HZA37_02510 [Parcubacteria group bacterium]|nr:hypothetical protein [Parcubacteria group bacterium]